MNSMIFQKLKVQRVLSSVRVRYFLENPGEELAGNLDDMVEAVDICVTSSLLFQATIPCFLEATRVELEKEGRVLKLSIRNSASSFQTADFILPTLFVSAV